MQVFEIAPAGTRPLWIFVPVALLVIVVFGLLVWSLLGVRYARFEVAPDGLRLRGDLYARSIPATDLRLDEARRVDRASDASLQPRRRTFGTALPGYQAGWFRLRNGEKALLYVTDWNRAVYVPTRAGYSVIVSPANPDAFLDALRTGGGRDHRR